MHKAQGGNRIFIDFPPHVLRVAALVFYGFVSCLRIAHTPKLSTRNTNKKQKNIFLLENVSKTEKSPFREAFAAEVFRVFKLLTRQFQIENVLCKIAEAQNVKFAP